MKSIGSIGEKILQAELRLWKDMVTHLHQLVGD